MPFPRRTHGHTDPPVDPLSTSKLYTAKAQCLQHFSQSQGLWPVRDSVSQMWICGPASVVQTKCFIIRPVIASGGFAIEAKQRNEDQGERRRGGGDDDQRSKLIMEYMLVQVGANVVGKHIREVHDRHQPGEGESLRALGAVVRGERE